jgi:hypothetical protein
MEIEVVRIDVCEFIAALRKHRILNAGCWPNSDHR